MIITIDGLDGSGKSSLARKLSAEYNYLFMDKPISNFFNQFVPANKKTIDDMNENITSYNSDFLSAYYELLSLVYLKESMNDQNIVLNGGLLTSYMQHGNDTTYDFYEVLVNQGLLFDLSILLYCNRDERLKRLRKKSINEEYLMNESLSMTTYDQVFEFIKKHPNSNVLVIDTTNLTMDEVFEIAKEEIEKIRQKLLTK